MNVLERNKLKSCNNGVLLWDVKDLTFLKEL